MSSWKSRWSRVRFVKTPAAKRTPSTRVRGPARATRPPSRTLCIRGRPSREADAERRAPPESCATPHVHRRETGHANRHRAERPHGNAAASNIDCEEIRGRRSFRCPGHANHLHHSLGWRRRGRELRERQPAVRSHRPWDFDTRRRRRLRHDGGGARVECLLARTSVPSARCAAKATKTCTGVDRPESLVMPVTVKCLERPARRALSRRANSPPARSSPCSSPTSWRRVLSSAPTTRASTRCRRPRLEGPSPRGGSAETKPSPVSCAVNPSFTSLRTASRALIPAGRASPVAGAAGAPADARRDMRLRHARGRCGDPAAPPAPAAPD